MAKEVIQESARVSRRREEIMKRKTELMRAQHEAHFKELEAEIARNHEKKRLEGGAAARTHARTPHPRRPRALASHPATPPRARHCLRPPCAADLCLRMGVG